MTVTTRARSFEDFAVGETFTSEPRLVTERDLLYCILWDGTSQPHDNEYYSQRSPWGARIIHGDGTLAMGIGLIHRLGLFDGTLVNYQGLSIRYPGPVYLNHQIRSHLRIEELEAGEPGEPGRVVARLTIENVSRGHPAVEATIHYLVARRS